jgi:hypothetical protein
MGYETAPFYAENKIGGGLISPAIKSFRFQQSVEGNVQLNAGKNGIVMAEPAFPGETRRIKPAAPMWIGETAATNEESGHNHPLLLGLWLVRSANATSPDAHRHPVNIIP